MVLLADVSELEVGGEKQTKRNFEKKLELFLSLLFHLSLSLSLSLRCLFFCRPSPSPPLLQHHLKVEKATL